MDIQKRLDNCKKTGFHISCEVESEHRDKYGNLISHDIQHNIVVDGGLNFLTANCASTNDTYRTNYIGLGISITPPIQTATELNGASYETALTGLARAAGAVSAPVSSIGFYQVSKTFTASIGNASIGCAGLYTRSTTPGYLFSAAALINPPTLSAGDTLSITWYVSFA